MNELYVDLYNFLTYIRRGSKFEMFYEKRVLTVIKIQIQGSIYLFLYANEFYFE